MHSAGTLLLKWLRYYFSASNGRGHGIHSPFVFEFIEKVLNDRKEYPAYIQIEQLREELLRNKTKLKIEDLGAGSSVNGGSRRSISDITKNAAKAKKWGQLLFRMAQYYKTENILELGTSLGISAAYLASGNPQGKLITLEGANAIASIAARNFNKLGLRNIELISGDFDNALPTVIVSNQLKPDELFDMVFVDGNHRKEPTLRYFEMLLPAMANASVIVFDDVHWSLEMEEAWKRICDDPRVMLSVDLFFIGLVFFRPAFKVKQHFNIRHGILR